MSDFWIRFWIDGMHIAYGAGVVVIVIFLLLLGMKLQQDTILKHIERYGFFTADERTILALEIETQRVHKAIVKGLHDETFEKKDAP